MEAALPCMEDGRQARFLFLPEGEDPDTIVRSGGKEQFELLMAAATPLETFLFESLSEGIDIDSMDGRARLSKLALPYIRELPEGVFRQLMFSALAQRTGLELSSLMQLEAPAMQPTPPPEYLQENEAPTSTPTPRQRQTTAAPIRNYSNFSQAAIALLLHQPKIASLADSKDLAEMEGDDISLLRELLELLQRRPDSNTAMLLGHWYGTTEGELLSQLAGQERLIPTEGIEQQFIDTIATLAELPQRSKLDQQVDKLKLTNYAEMSELEKEQVKELLKQKQLRDARRGKKRP